MKNLLILLLSVLIMGFSCTDSTKPVSRNCLSGVIIGNGCTNEGFLIDVAELKDEEIEVASVKITNKTYFNVIMSLRLPNEDYWQVGDIIYFEISEIPVEKDSYFCQDLYLTAPTYNLIRISKNNCL